ncbi:chromosomal replication initiation protein DnaA [Chromatiales bacterium (ex Bugula neritina AB1)]|nr:chromosomal replication initiation protein DnaA [Chromatiales bacterium (ex Bugula neritina AB1)]
MYWEYRSLSVWNRCLSHLSNELSIEEMNTWVLCLQPLETDSEIRLLAPNRFVHDWVRDKYAKRISEIASSLAKVESFNVHLDIGTGEIIAPAKPLEEARAIPPQQTEAVSRPVFFSEEPRAPLDPNFKTALNPAFTFDTYVEGKSNQIGRAAAVQIGQNPGKSYNPLFIYGGVGLGKTHLMHAVGNLMVSQGKTRVQYLHSERYVREMVRSLQNNTINDFKRHYRSLDALLIDDIQFFAKKDRSQEEFFHTFNSLIEEGQQIILTSDRYPKEIEGVEERLKSRFGWGLTVSVEPPELETRVAILNTKAEQSGYTLPDDVSFFIAQRINSNVRELEGALRRVMANSQFTGKPITIEFAREALKDLLAVQEKLVSMDNIQRTVCEYYKVRSSELLSKKRNRSIARPRQVAMYLSKVLTRHSLPEIGEAFGGRDHTTVIHAHKKIKDLQQSDSRMEEDIKILTRLLSC